MIDGHHDGGRRDTRGMARRRRSLVELSLEYGRTHGADMVQGITCAGRFNINPRGEGWVDSARHTSGSG